MRRFLPLFFKIILYIIAKDSDEVLPINECYVSYLLYILACLVTS